MIKLTRGEAWICDRVVASLRDGAPIGEYEARTIASWFARGGEVSASARFSDTGHLADPQAVWDEVAGFRWFEREQWQRSCLLALAEYLHVRVIDRPPSIG